MDAPDSYDPGTKVLQNSPYISKLSSSDFHVFEKCF